MPIPSLSDCRRALVLCFNTPIYPLNPENEKVAKWAKETFKILTGAACIATIGSIAFVGTTSAVIFGLVAVVAAVAAIRFGYIILQNQTSLEPISESESEEEPVSEKEPHSVSKPETSTGKGPLTALQEVTRKLQALIDMDWKWGIPNQDLELCIESDVIDCLTYFGELVEACRPLANSEEVIRIIEEKCRKYIQNLKQNEVGALSLFHEIFGFREISNDAFKFKFDNGEELELPAYAKFVLGKRSIYFTKLFFNAGMVEGKSAVIPIKDIEKKVFLKLIALADCIGLLPELGYEALTFNSEADLQALYELLSLADRFQLAPAVKNITQRIESVLRGFSNTKNTFTELLKLIKALPDTTSDADTLFRGLLETKINAYIKDLPVSARDQLPAIVNELKEAKVQSLTLPAWVTDEDLKLVKDLRLTKIVIQSKHVTDAGLVHISDMESLTHVDLSDTLTSDEGLKSFQKMKLKTLILDKTPVKGNGFVHLQKTLRLLSAKNTPMEDKSLEHLKDHPLEELDLFLCRSITGKGFYDFRMNISIRVLDLSYTNLDNVGMQHIFYMNALTSLSLRGQKHIDFVHLEGKKIEFLDASETEFANRHAPMLVGMPLIFLYLNKTKVTDLCFGALVKLPIYQLNMEETGVTDDGLLLVPEMSHLHSLTLNGCKGVTQNGVEELKEAFLPRSLQVHFNPALSLY